VGADCERGPESALVDIFLYLFLVCGFFCTTFNLVNLAVGKIIFDIFGDN
jgi:hypothetical protein